MVMSKERRQGAYLTALSVAGLAFCALPHQAQAQTAGNYFDPNGSAVGGLGTPATGSLYNWDDTSTGGLWNTNSAGTGTNSAWFGTAIQGGFPRFSVGTSGTSYTVVVSNDEQIAGMFETVNGVNLTVNASGSGALDVTSGVQGIINGGSASTLTINAPITGVGGINPSNGGNIYLNGVNTYMGGTTVTASNTLIHFNNGSAFGGAQGGTITNNLASATTFVPLLASGGTTITLPNNFAQGPLALSGAGLNFAADANTPVISTGTWSLGAKNLNLRNNGTSSSPLTLTNTISGTANLIVSGANGGTIIFQGANTYSGTTTVGATAATAITLTLGAANTIASSSSLIMAGGTLNPGGVNQIMSSTTLGMTASSTINFITGASELDFANSSGLSWTGTLNLANWNPAMDALRFGNDGTGLTAAQLNSISFNGGSAGTARLNSSGFLVTGSAAPEPSAWALMGVGLSALGLRARKLRSRRSKADKA